MKMNKRKLGAFVLVMGLAMGSMTVCAEGYNYVKFTGGQQVTESQGTVTVGGFGDNKNSYEGAQEPSASNIPEDITLAQGDGWQNTSANKSYIYDGSTWVEQTFEAPGPSVGGSSATSTSKSGSMEEDALREAVEKEAAQKEAAEKEAAQIIAHAETIALQAEAVEEGFADIADLQIAAEKNMSAGEYYNNAVIETAGIEEATPVAQGGSLVVDGVVTNMTATISKVDVAFVNSVCAAQEGTVLNVVDVRFPAKAATINFYMPGVTADENIVALQYVDGAWVNVEITEVRADHVVLNLKQNGRVAFIAK